jgi:hypothetical protein
MVCTVPMMEALVIWSMHGRDNLDSLVITSNPFSGWLSGVSPLSFLLSVGTCGFKGILSAEGAVAVCSRMCRKKSFQNLISWIFKQNVRVVGPQGPGSKTQHTFWFDLTPPQPWSHWSLLSFSQARFQSQTLNPYASASEYAFVMLMMPTSHVEVFPDFHKSNTGSSQCNSCAWNSMLYCNHIFMVCSWGFATCFGCLILLFQLESGKRGWFLYLNSGLISNLYVWHVLILLHWFVQYLWRGSRGQKGCCKLYETMQTSFSVHQ